MSLCTTVRIDFLREVDILPVLLEEFFQVLVLTNKPLSSTGTCRSVCNPRASWRLQSWVLSLLSRLVFIWIAALHFHQLNFPILTLHISVLDLVSG